jgi:hypothetical protein
VACGSLNFSSSQKNALVFVGAISFAGIVLSTLVFPFWNLIREDMYEEVVIITNDDGICYVETTDNIPKIIDNCILNSGDKTTIKFGKDLAWGVIVT